MLRSQAFRRVLRDPIRGLWSRPYQITIRDQKRPTIAHARTRGLATAAIPSVLVPPLMFIGLLVGLWTWKCFWIIAMQNKLLYLTWLPPFTRSEVISDYEAECKPVHWEEKQIRSLDGTKLAVCEGRVLGVSRDGKSLAARNAVHEYHGSERDRKKSVVICYFQGNGGSTPMRLPLLSQVLRAISDASPSDSNPKTRIAEYTIVALSYRGYWKSSGRATQSGLEMDAQACLKWVSETYGGPHTDLEIVIWGHSLGAAVATAAVPTYIAQRGQFDEMCNDQSRAPITGLILEAPTSSIKDMLISLYPQKWLPYRYLWPFSWNNWDIKASLRKLATWRDQNADMVRYQSSDQSSEMVTRSGVIPPIFLLSAEKDEVIPSYVPGQIQEQARSLGLYLEAKSVSGAMHTEAPLKLYGRKALVGFIMNGPSVDQKIPQ